MTADSFWAAPPLVALDVRLHLFVAFFPRRRKVPASECVQDGRHHSITQHHRHAAHAAACPAPLGSQPWRRPTGPVPAMGAHRGLKPGSTRCGGPTTLRRLASSAPQLWHSPNRPACAAHDRPSAGPAYGPAAPPEHTRDRQPASMAHYDGTLTTMNRAVREPAVEDALELEQQLDVAVDCHAHLCADRICRASRANRSRCNAGCIRERKCAWNGLVCSSQRPVGVAMV